MLYNARRYLLLFTFQPEADKETSAGLKAMEQLSLNGGNGQSYGYIVYRKRVSLKQGSILSMRGRPRDLMLVKPI